MDYELIINKKFFFFFILLGLNVFLYSKLLISFLQITRRCFGGEYIFPSLKNYKRYDFVSVIIFDLSTFSRLRGNDLRFCQFIIYQVLPIQGNP